MTQTSTRIEKPFTDVKCGDVVHFYGVPFVVTSSPKSMGGRIFFVGTYRGEALGRYFDGNPLAPFVTKDGDEWTFQRAEWCAKLYSTDDGETWRAGIG